MLEESSVAVAQTVEHLPCDHEIVGLSPTLSEFFHMFVRASAYSVGAELSYLGFG